MATVTGSATTVFAFRVFVGSNEVVVCKERRAKTCSSSLALVASVVGYRILLFQHTKRASSRQKGRSSEAMRGGARIGTVPWLETRCTKLRVQVQGQIMWVMDEVLSRLVGRDVAGSSEKRVAGRKW